MCRLDQHLCMESTGCGRREMLPQRGPQQNISIPCSEHPDLDNSCRLSLLSVHCHTQLEVLCLPALHMPLQSQLLLLPSW